MGQGIRLVPYEEQYHQDLTRFTLKNEQVHFTALPAQVIEEAMINPDKDPIVILHQAVPVGFFVLHKGSEYVESVESDHKILIRALSISEQYQGKGYALDAMKQLPDWVREFHPEIDEIILAVNEANKAAYQFYVKSGFLDLGLTRMGNRGIQHILCYSMIKERSL
ncbi:GNAT family N-acetyltransferase [Paenibacillus cucumis (ex Kampfer et al. 2016)]|uniref:GNAT family N-acetyltransferase n=1 Tax=Paenibacillus cucumis (ex Kampfer et al. 2016) TaxID=1776858 RepID=A0ABS7KDW5_9BACL|nr:GNAT family N-acetyltransferase [Paenibacillus cucumis (ex Kampfer et al. 2016)]MBY0202330.1 GNAT family N-acetyltransferase [Paenibacillus cucumis (ex Kampfer et al. 2016)]